MGLGVACAAMRLRVPALVLAAASFACGSHEPTPSSPVAAAGLAPARELPPAVRADGRLSGTAIPTHYELTLDLDPAKDTFDGSIAIAVRVPVATSFVVLHANGLRVAEATIDGKPVKITVRGQELVLETAQPLAPSTVTLQLRYQGTYSQSLDGLYRAKDAVYTDFEPVDARKAFPCFDEPSLKAPYRIRVRVPKGQLAFSNGAEVARTDEAGGAHTVFEFAETPPLPSYLVAVAAGKLAVLEGPKSPWPIRVIARPEALEGERGKAALTVAADTLALLEKWFDIPYAYKKLDLVAVPDFGSGAMENAGLVTFREELLLVDPAKDSRRARRSMESVITHELAHQWFGDLVTTAWWDDIWLNEGFASFMEAEILDEWKPGYGATLDRLVDSQRAMELDALPSARKVRQPVVSAGDAREAFDPITYDKGAMLLAMTQSWLGKPGFQQAISSYLKKHANGNATASDLFAELDAAGSLGSARISSVLADYLDKPGVPWLGAEGSKEGAWVPRGVTAPTHASW
ncbi:MAG: M1 family peptidase, partial [Proteobacteria bacterium]